MRKVPLTIQPSPEAIRYAEKHVEVTAAGCWEWTGSRYSNGYGTAHFQGSTFMAHRFVYEIQREPIPAGLVLDHLCRNPPCVNPAHLEPVTNRENLARGEHHWAKVARTGECLRGHQISGDNLYVSPHGIRKCRACMKILRLERYLRYKAANGIGDMPTKGVCEEADCGREHYAKGVCKLHYNRRRAGRTPAA